MKKAILFSFVMAMLFNLNVDFSLAAEVENLIANPSVETVSPTNSTVPANWAKGGYGTNTRIFSYPVVPGSDGDKAIKVEITSYTSGDAKWYFDDVPVISGHTYIFSDSYKSDLNSIITVRFKLSNGSYIYKDIGLGDITDTYKNAYFLTVAPTNSVSATVFHLINKTGYLITDEYMFREATPNPPPPDEGNLIVNGNFEQTDSAGMPLNWKKGGWGTNIKTYPYPIIGNDGSKAAKVVITDYTSGDVKWYFKPMIAPVGTYTYSDEFFSNVRSMVVVQYQYKDGSFGWRNLAMLDSTPTGWSNMSTDFNLTADVANFTVFHLINSVGTLTVDNVSIKAK